MGSCNIYKLCDFRKKIVLEYSPEIEGNYICFHMLENMKFKLQNNIYNFWEEINEILSSTGYESKTNTDEVSKVMNNKFPGWYVNKVLVETNERLRKEHTDLYHPI